jgi:meso-butanediol dehydrogenase/(S,S)-butanediol dehydrogenase/diacetyl reductase
MVKLANKVALITGATRGIGRATALAFAAEGARLMLTGRNEAAGAAALAECAARAAEAAFSPVDLVESAACETLIEETVARFGRLDVLVNNAGVVHAAGTLETTDAQYFEQMAVNTTAVFFLSRAAARVMKAQGGGTIVNVASDLGLRGEKGITAYCMSKGAVVQLTRAMAIDQAEDNIRVNAVCPGEIHTDMLENAIRGRGWGIAEGIAQLNKRVPVGRIGTPEEIARAILFLACDDSSFCTGALLSADGGKVAQ